MKTQITPLRLLLLITSILFSGSTTIHGAKYLNLSTLKVEDNITTEPTRTVKSAMHNFMDGYMITYDFNYIEIENDDLFPSTHQLRIPGFGMVDKSTAPMIPGRLDPILLGEDVTGTLSICDTVYVEYDIEIAPARYPLSDNSEYWKASDIEAINPVNSFYPAKPVEIFDTQKYRGQSILYARVNPIKYNPVTKKAKILTKLRYFVGKLHSAPIAPTMAAENSLQDLPHFDRNILSNMVINEMSDDASIADSAFLAAKPISKKYLIISTPTFKNAVDQFALWKNKLGFNTITELRNNWTSTSIAEYIKTTYTDNPDIYYALIIGDVTHVPTNIRTLSARPGKVYTFPTDIPYTNLDGNSDYISEFPIGRICCSTSSEAISIISKSIKYEKEPVSDPNFYRSILGAAEFEIFPPTKYNLNIGQETRHFFSTAETIRNYMINQSVVTYPDDNPFKYTSAHYNQDRFYFTQEIISPKLTFNGEKLPTELLRPNYNWDSNSNDIIDALNQGRFLAIHRDHGDTACWCHPNFSSSHVARLRNYGKLPIILSINCLTGRFTHNDCLTATLVKHIDGGAAAAIGASEISYSIYNDVLALGMIDAIWPNPGLKSYLYNSPTSNHNRKSITAIGDVLQQGLQRMREHYGTNNITCVYESAIFHVFGDPSLSIPTAKPIHIHNSTAIFDGNTIQISISPYKATISIIDTTNGNVERYEGSNLTYPATSFDNYEVWISGNGFVPVKIPISSTIPNEITSDSLILESITPNPTNGTSKLTLNKSIPQGTKIIATNIFTGQTTEYSPDISSSSFCIDFSALSSGTYSVCIMNGNRISNSQKLIIK